MRTIAPASRLARRRVASPLALTSLALAWSGVFKSTDAGATWASSSSGITATQVNALAMDPSAPATLYAGTFQGGVFKSTNGGANWSPASKGLPALNFQIVDAIAASPSAPATVFAGTDGGGVFRSTNAAGRSQHERGHERGHELGPRQPGPDQPLRAVTCRGPDERRAALRRNVRRGLPLHGWRRPVGSGQ